ncbi:hypothetical protein NOR_01164 [Metarhizium rileyi]|uniref:Uncharacterized protein n=1 Tax=Metarhizium rileyi (strain RCEF 4871) TaxID=1649241 RepID=A0A167IMW1_METRR|nr:hypothetical protein NOR_01164 [Metarhizium rileyi RCEF 4871]
MVCQVRASRETDKSLNSSFAVWKAAKAPSSDEAHERPVHVVLTVWPAVAFDSSNLNEFWCMGETATGNAKCQVPGYLVWYLSNLT